MKVGQYSGLGYGVFLQKKVIFEDIINVNQRGCDLFMEVNLIILPKKNSDINLGMKRQIRQLFEKLFNDVNDSSFLINIDDNVEIQYKISSKEKNMVFLKLSCDGTSVKAAKYLDFATNRLIQGGTQENLEYSHII